MNEMPIKKEQISFFRTGKGGCIFASIAAKDPQKYGWYQKIVELDGYQIEKLITQAIESTEITTLSLIFPSVNTPNALISLIEVTRGLSGILIDQDVIYEDFRCLGLRVKVNGNQSWVAGFGPFEFLPQTRQAPYTELAFRVKPRPNYGWNMKTPISGVVHIADLDMKGVKKQTFIKWWNASLENTKKVLGYSPDLKSAAKTTYAIPQELFK